MITPKKPNPPVSPAPARKTEEVTCPHCQATQQEPVGVISTNCKSCGNYFRLAEARPSRTAYAPKATPQGGVREIICAQCQSPNRVSDAAMSTQCVKCSNYLDLRDVVIRGSSGERILTYGELSFANGSAFRGFSAQATRIEVFGKVFSKLQSATEILVGDGGQISGEIRAKAVNFQRGSSAHVQTIHCRKLLIEGQVEVIGAVETDEIIVKNGGGLKASSFRAQSIKVDEGCSMEGELETVAPAVVAAEPTPQAADDQVEQKEV